MKIETQHQGFTPVTITIESEAELTFFRDVMGDSSDEVEAAYKLPRLYPLFDKLDKIFDERNIPKKSPMRVEFVKE